MNKKELRFCDEICDMIATIIIQKQEEIKPDLDAKIWVQNIILNKYYKLLKYLTYSFNIYPP